MVKVNFKGISTLKLDNKGRISIPKNHIFISEEKPKNLEFILDIDSSLGPKLECLKFSLTEQSLLGYPITTTNSKSTYRIQISSTYVALAGLTNETDSYFIGLGSSFLIANEKVGKKMIYTLGHKTQIINMYQRAVND